MISVENLYKKFDRTPALTDVSINVNSGSIYGLVGSNGAGKTTLLKHITGILKSDSGVVKIDNELSYENMDIKRRVAFIPDDLDFFNSYNLYDAARFYKSLYPRWNDDIFSGLIDKFKLDKKRKMSKFSKGMRKQGVFALTLAVEPDFLILDEPIDGLDPIARKVMWKAIVDASAERNMTTLVSSHNLKEMEGICDYIGILSKGSLVLERDLDELKSDLHKVQFSFYDDVDSNERYSSLNVLHLESRGAVDLLIVKENKETIEDFAEKNHPTIFDIIPLSLEEIFIYELGGGDNEIESSIF